MLALPVHPAFALRPTHSKTTLGFLGERESGAAEGLPEVRASVSIVLLYAAGVRRDELSGMSGKTRRPPRADWRANYGTHSALGSGQFAPVLGG